MKYKSDFGEYEVKVQLNTYQNNGTLAIMLFEPGEGPFTSLTVNIEDSNRYASESKAFVDTNNNPEAIAFIEENKLGQFTGITGNSGFCTYPLYEFDLNKLRSELL